MSPVSCGKIVLMDESKVKIAIERLQTFEPLEGYYLAFSGGKDSIVIKQLAIEAGVKFDAHYSVTTIDPPDLIYYMREYHSDVEWDHPKEPFLSKMAKKGFPMRQKRWCCEEYKERGGSGRLVVTGIRWAESYTRKSRKMVEHCLKDKTKRFVHPIIDWTEENVWGFIRNRKLPYCGLYDEGWKRIGCLFCPFQGKKSRLREVSRFPKYAEAFRRAFRKLYADRKERGMKSVERWGNGDEMFDWWLHG